MSQIPGSDARAQGGLGNNNNNNNNNENRQIWYQVFVHLKSSGLCFNASPWIYIIVEGVV